MLISFSEELWLILLELSGPLLFGLLLAGILSVLMPKDFVRRWLSGSNRRSVFAAVLVGVPLPLCSCGVVPTALGLRKMGASRGASAGFLISTPQTGVDSILVSASFLGWPFALFKVLAAFVTGCLGGVLVNAFEDGGSEEGPLSKVAQENTLTPEDGGKIRSLQSRVLEIFNYSVIELLGMIDKYLIVGIIVAALISVLLPEGALSDSAWTSGLSGMFLALAISLPLYVCSTSSVPIAASLISAGMPLGTALVFLMAGPATNVATLGAVYRGLGGRVTAIYLAVLALGSIAFGLFFEWILPQSSALPTMHAHQAGVLRQFWVFVLLALLLFLSLRRILLARGRMELDEKTSRRLEMSVEGISCGNCANKIRSALLKLSGVASVEVDVKSGMVIVSGGSFSLERASAAIAASGFKVLSSSNLSDGTHEKCC